MARSFIDTNVLLYASDEADPVKKTIAEDLIGSLYARREAVLSIQVIQEYAVNATRKLGLDPAVARRRVELFGRFEVVVPSVSMVVAAMDMQRSYPVSFWDAMVIQAANEAGCTVLFTEDMQHDRVFGNVRIRNPFDQGSARYSQQ